jgi:hypothetical protein
MSQYRKFGMNSKKQQIKSRLQVIMGDKFDEKYFDTTWDHTVNNCISLDELCQVIQPVINKEHRIDIMGDKPLEEGETPEDRVISPHENIKANIYLTKYCAEGYDPEYWTSGAGAAGNCSMM